jgi:hypothetical protein
MKSTLIFIAVVISLFVAMFVYAIKDNHHIQEKKTFDTKIHSLSYNDSFVLNELDNSFIIDYTESQLNKDSDSIYLGNTLCRKIGKDGGTYLLSRDNSSIFRVTVSTERINPESTGKLLKVSVDRK